MGVPLRLNLQPVWGLLLVTELCTFIVHPSHLQVGGVRNLRLTVALYTHYQTVSLCDSNSLRDVTCLRVTTLGAAFFLLNVLLPWKMGKCCS